MAEDTDEHPEQERTFPDGYVTKRDTSPMRDYTQREVLVGAAVALVGLLVTFGIPLLLT